MPTPTTTWRQLGQASKVGAFKMPGYWIWCGSVIQSDDGRYHMFASRWSMDYDFSHWATKSEVVRAESASPLGPYEFKEVVLPARGPEYWDGRMSHNPTIHCHGDTYLLFYTGVTYPFEITPVTQYSTREQVDVMHSKQIGLAHAPSPEGPWTRFEEPILSTKPESWDNFFVSNAAPVVHEDGSVLLIYKGLRTAQTPELLREKEKPLNEYTKPAENLFLSVAKAEHWSGPYTRALSMPILKKETIDQDQGIEDPYVWHNGTHYELLCKDMTGKLCGVVHGGVHAWSMDGLDWHLYENPLGYKRTVKWSDGSESTQGQLERCELLVKDGIPQYMFAATGDGPGGFGNMTHTFNVCIPLVDCLKEDKHLERFKMTAKVDQLAEIIWEYHLLHHELRKSDCILALGSNDVRIAEHAAKLFHEGWASLLIFSGGIGKLTQGQYQCSEAEYFYNIAVDMGVPKSHILIEPASTNTGENIRFTQDLLAGRKMDPNDFIVVQKPFMERRSYATFKKHWPEKNILLSSPNLSFLKYPNQYLSKEHIINVHGWRFATHQGIPFKRFSNPSGYSR